MKKKIFILLQLFHFLNMISLYLLIGWHLTLTVGRASLLQY